MPRDSEPPKTFKQIMAEGQAMIDEAQGAIDEFREAEARNAAVEEHMRTTHPRLFAYLNGIPQIGLN